MVLTAGCNFISPQTTTEHYDASDGFSTTVGDVELRNAIVFTDNGDSASLSVTLLNTSDTAQKVNFQYSSLGSTETTSVEVPASTSISRGTQDGDPQILLSGIGKQPGTLMKIFIQAGSKTGKNFNIPVLDGSFPQYATLLPSPTPSSLPSILPVPYSTGTPAPSAKK